MPLNIISQPELLTTAVCRGDLARVREMLDHGASAAVSGQHGLSPVHWAVQMGHVDVLKLLLARGGSANDATNEGLTPLHMAAREGDVDMARALLAAGGDARARSRDKKTALDLADDDEAELLRLLRDAVGPPRGKFSFAGRAPPPAAAPAAPPPTAVGPEAVAAAQWRAIQAVRRHGAALAAAPFATRTFATDPSGTRTFATDTSDLGSGTLRGSL